MSGVKRRTGFSQHISPYHYSNITLDPLTNDDDDNNHNNNNFGTTGHARSDSDGSVPRHQASCATCSTGIFRVDFLPPPNIPLEEVFNSRFTLSLSPTCFSRSAPDALEGMVKSICGG